MSANIFHIWLTVAGFEKLAGVIRNQKRRSILNYLPDSLHLVAKVKVSIFFCETRQVAVLRVYFTPRTNCTLQPLFDFIAFSESVHTNRIFLRTAFCLLPFFFLHESAFRQHETNESAHRNRIFLKPLRVV